MRDIKGYESLYAVTSCGKIFSYRKKKFLSPRKNNSGYLRVALYKDGKAKDFLVHRLVAEAYLPNPANLPQVNHIDEDKTNNALLNLEWCTAAENVNYSQARKVICLETNEVFDSMTLAAQAKNINVGNISNVCQGKLKTTGNLHWRYYEEQEN